MMTGTARAPRDPGWTIERSTGPAGDFHRRDIGDVDRPSVWIHRVERSALVLGSSQRDDLVDRERAAELDIEVCRRRSGGGLVLVDPAASCWIDVIVTPDSPLWDVDVNRSFLWVGQVWASALAALGVDRLSVHRGPILDREAGRFLCFAGTGPGEVVRAATDGGPPFKVVGLSQRRQRTAARFQGLFVGSTDLDLTAALLTEGAWPPDLDAAALRIGLDHSSDDHPGNDPATDGASTTATDRLVAELPARFLDALPRV